MDKEERRDAGVTLATVEVKAEVHPVGIAIRQHGWIVWGQIAIDHEREAREARRRDPAYEHLPGLVAIAGAAFALDALYGVARGLIPVEEVDRAEDGGDEAGRKRARHVAERLRRGVSPGRLAQTWPARIRELYKTRDEAMHYGERDASPVWHPALQSNIAPQAFEYRLEAAETAIDLMLEVFEGWGRRPSAPIREWAERFRPSVDDLVNRRSN